MNQCSVVLTKSAQKQLKKTPHHIQRKFEYWLDWIETMGLQKARQYRGFHDEPLKGNRQHQRSVRLSRGYRIIYVERQSQSKLLLEIIEVTKHAY